MLVLLGTKCLNVQQHRRQCNQSSSAESPSIVQENSLMRLSHSPLHINSFCVGPRIFEFWLPWCIRPTPPDDNRVDTVVKPQDNSVRHRPTPPPPPNALVGLKLVPHGATHGALVLYPRHGRAIVTCTLLDDNAQWEPNPLLEAPAPWEQVGSPPNAWVGRLL